MFWDISLVLSVVISDKGKKHIFSGQVIRCQLCTFSKDPFYSHFVTDFNLGLSENCCKKGFCSPTEQNYNQYYPARMCCHSFPKQSWCCSGSAVETVLLFFLFFNWLHIIKFKHIKLKTLPFNPCKVLKLLFNSFSQFSLSLAKLKHCKHECCYM